MNAMTRMLPVRPVMVLYGLLNIVCVIGTLLIEVINERTGQCPRHLCVAEYSKVNYHTTCVAITTSNADFCRETT